MSSGSKILRRIEKLAASQHFQLSELAPGIYAAVCGNRGAGIGNAGLIDLGDRTLVFDTFLTPQAATHLLDMAVDLTGRNPELVINSHYHNDHIWGNQVFLPQALILSSVGTRDLIKTTGQEEYDFYGEYSGKRLAELRQEYEEAEDAVKKEELAPWLDYYGGLVEAFPTLKMCLPQLTFPEKLTIYGRNRRVELINFENGHTGSDTILYLPDDQIIFSADLLFVQVHPFLAEADPYQAITILEQIEAMPFTQIVPGHGPVGSKEDVRLMIEYIRTCIETAEQMMAEGNQDDEASAALAIATLAIPEPYTEWQIPHFFQTNILHLIKVLSSEAN